MLDRCLHADAIEHCPLYVAAHDPEADGLSCLYGDWEQGCAVDRGEASYAELVTRLRARCPRLVAIVEFQAEAAVARAQRRRNLRLNGIH